MPERNLNILLIEDNDDHAELFLANLVLTAYAASRVVRQETLEAALDSLQAERFELIFIDLALRDSSIAQTLRRLRDLAACCPAIVLTSLDDRKTILDIISKGADDCLPKSELNDVLLERLIHFNLDRRQLKRQLIKSEEAYRDLHDNSPNMLGSVDAKTRQVLICNQTFAKQLGWSVREIVGRRIDEFYHPDSLEAFRQIFASFLETGMIANAELQLRRRDGSTIDVLLNASAVRDEQGRILHTRSTWIDITAKKAAERQLQHVQQLNRLIIDTVPDLLWIKNAAGAFLACNHRVEQLFGRPKAEIIGRTAHELTTADRANVFRQHDQLAAASGKAVRSEEWVDFAGDGGKVLLEATNTPFFDEQGQVAGVIGLAHDITELREAAEKAEAASRAKSVFLSNMSHELRTPLNAILGYTQLLGNEENLTARQRNGIRTIHQAGEHLLLLINDILDISKIESGRLELICTEFRLASFLGSISEIIWLRAKDKGIAFSHEASGPLPTAIVADELRLRQVILNLLSNAVKFTRCGGCLFQVGAEETDSPGRMRLTIAVEDSGPGIAAEEQDMVFEPFIQVGERLQHREGTGLGLAISRQLVRLMGGELQLISPANSRPQPGEGPGCRFMFSIEVPVLASLAAEHSPPHRKVTGYAVPDSGPKRVLIVDDKQSNRAVLHDTLEPLGFLVREAADGSEVLTACAAFQPDVILMDLRMPQLDGFAATALLKQQPAFAQIPVLAVTASIAEGNEIRERCQACGFSSYVHKPFAATELLELIAAHAGIQLLYSSTALPPEQTGAMVLPSQEDLDELARLADVGEVQAIAEKAAALAAAEAGRYQVFSRRVQEMAEELQFTALQQFLAGQQQR